MNGVERCIDDEIPFEIPKNWRWCRLHSLASKDIKRGKSPTYSATGKVLVFAQKCNVKTGGVNLSLSQRLNDSAFLKYPSEEYMQDSDIVINSTGTGTLGRVGLYHFTDNPNNETVVPDSHITIVRITKELCSEYLYHCIKWWQPFLEENGEGSTNQKELRPDTIKNLLVPVPPLAEQHRIVAAYNSLLPYIEQL